MDTGYVIQSSYSCSLWLEYTLSFEENCIISPRQQLQNTDSYFSPGMET